MSQPKTGAYGSERAHGAYGSERGHGTYGSEKGHGHPKLSPAAFSWVASSRLTLERQLQDRPKPAAEPQNFIAKECYAIKCTFFSHSTSALVAINLLIGFVPLGLAAGKLGWGLLATFGFNFLAIMPLAAVLGAATEALSVHTGQTMGGLLNATLGNAVEMSLTVSAIQAGMVDVVQMSLIGSILSNLLLVLGMSFVSAGIKTHQSSFNQGGTGANITCLILASLALTLPTVFNHVPDTTPEDGLMLSRIIALVMGFVYICFLIFQLGTHASLFEQDGEDPATDATFPTLHPVTATVILVLTTFAVYLCSEYLVDSIEGVCKTYGMPRAFIGLILLPIVGNAAEHTTAITAAYHDMMDLALGVAIGSSTQIALFVIPFSVITGWICGVPMSLDFEIFSTTVFILSVFIASGVLGDGSGNWFEGLMLVATYCIVAIITWYIPDAVNGRELSMAHPAADPAALALPMTFLNQTTLVI